MTEGINLVHGGYMGLSMLVFIVVVIICLVITRLVLKQEINFSYFFVVVFAFIFFIVVSTFVPLDKTGYLIEKENIKEGVQLEVVKKIQDGKTCYSWIKKFGIDEENENTPDSKLANICYAPGTIFIVTYDTIYVRTEN